VTLAEIVQQLDTWDEDFVVCAKAPWSGTAEATVVPFEEDGRVPRSVLDAGYKYFLGVATARETLEVFGDRPTSLKERIDCLVYYAENDAFPAWVYE
jgi:hypothetical protein